MKSSATRLSFFICLLLVAGCGSFRSSPVADSGIEGEISVVIQDEEPGTELMLGFSSVIPPDGDLEKSYRYAAGQAEFTSVWVGSPKVGAWNLADTLAGDWGITFLDEFIRGNGLIPIINLSFLDKDPISGKLILKEPEPGAYSGLNDPRFRGDYLQGALEVVKVSQPRFLSLGNEVNRWYEEYGAEPGDPNGFQHFASLYEEIYQEVKRISPETIVFCIFAREIVSENRAANLSVLSYFDPEMIDLLVFTTYPFAVQEINAVSDIPDDYYLDAWKILGDKNISMGFTEIAWSSLDYFGGESSQVEFLRDITGRLTIDQEIPLQFLAWWSLYDLENDPHQSGLISQEYREKPVFREWEVLYNSTRK